MSTVDTGANGTCADVLRAHQQTIETRRIILQCAATGDLERMIELMDSTGCTPNFNDDSAPFHVTPLSRAVENGHIHVVRELLLRGADMDELVGWWEEPQSIFETAIYSGHVETAMLLLDVLPVYSRSPVLEAGLHAAIRSNYPALVRRFVEAGASTASWFMFAGQQAFTALELACWYGSLDAVTALLELGEDPNTRDEYGLTPMMLAALNGAMNVIPLLEEYGADRQLRDYDGLTVDDYIARHGERRWR